MSIYRPDIYDLLDTMTLDEKERLLEELRLMIHTEKNAPEKSYLEEEWDEIRRLLKTLEYEPYIDDQLEIEEIWNICDKLVKERRLKEESWELRKKILSEIIEGEYFDCYGVYDPMKDLFSALCFTQKEKLECADLTYQIGSDYMKADGAKLYKECGKSEKYYEYLEQHLGYEEATYRELIDYYKEWDIEKAVGIAELGLQKCKKDQTNIIIFLLRIARDNGDEEKYAKLMKSAKMRRAVNFEKVEAALRTKNH